MKNIRSLSEASKCRDVEERKHANFMSNEKEKERLFLIVLIIQSDKKWRFCFSRF